MENTNSSPADQEAASTSESNRKKQKTGTGLRQGGRKLSNEWCHVEYFRGEPICKYCKIKLIAKIERVVKHMKICPKCDHTQNVSTDELSEVTTLLDSDDDGDGNVTSASAIASSSGSNSSSYNIEIKATTTSETVSKSVSIRPKIQTNLSTFVVKTTMQKKKRIDEKIAAYFMPLEQLFCRLKAILS